MKISTYLIQTILVLLLSNTVVPKNCFCESFEHKSSRYTQLTTYLNTNYVHEVISNIIDSFNSFNKVFHYLPGYESIDLIAKPEDHAIINFKRKIHKANHVEQMEMLKSTTRSVPMNAEKLLFGDEGFYIYYGHMDMKKSVSNGNKMEFSKQYQITFTTQLAPELGGITNSIPRDGQKKHEQELFERAVQDKLIGMIGKENRQSMVRQSVVTNKNKLKEERAYMEREREMPKVDYVIQDLLTTNFEYYICLNFSIFISKMLTRKRRDYDWQGAMMSGNNCSDKIEMIPKVRLAPLKRKITVYKAPVGKAKINTSNPFESKGTSRKSVLRKSIIDLSKQTNKGVNRSKLRNPNSSQFKFKRNFEQRQSGLGKGTLLNLDTGNNIAAAKLNSKIGTGVFSQMNLPQNGTIDALRKKIQLKGQNQIIKPVITTDINTAIKAEHNHQPIKTFDNKSKEQKTKRRKNILEIDEDDPSTNSKNSGKPPLNTIKKDEISEERDNSLYSLFIEKTLKAMKSQEAYDKDFIVQGSIEPIYNSETQKNVFKEVLLTDYNKIPQIESFFENTGTAVRIRQLDEQELDLQVKQQMNSINQEGSDPEALKNQIKQEIIQNHTKHMNSQIKDIMIRKQKLKFAKDFFLFFTEQNRNLINKYGEEKVKAAIYADARVVTDEVLVREFLKSNSYLIEVKINNSLVPKRIKNVDVVFNFITTITDGQTGIKLESADDNDEIKRKYPEQYQQWLKQAVELFRQKHNIKADHVEDEQGNKINV